MPKTVFITGASRGIGRAAACAFAQAGYQVAVNYRQNHRLAQELVEQLSAQGARAARFCADVSNSAQITTAIENATQEFGQIDVLINNAAIAQQQLFSDITPEQWRQMFAVNIDGIFYTCQAVLPQMLHRKAGKIINLSSIWGMVGASCEVAYSASKAAVIGLTKALAKELGPSHIQVNCVAPGVIETEMNCNLTAEDLAALREETPLETLGKPEDVANLLVFLASAQADFITGQVISPNGGFVI